MVFYFIAVCEVGGRDGTPAGLQGSFRCWSLAQVLGRKYVTNNDQLSDNKIAI
jgi:hypothetical protein